jgi:hypothetical protein
VVQNQMVGAPVRMQEQNAGGVRSQAKWWVASGSVGSLVASDNASGSSGLVSVRWPRGRLAVAWRQQAAD